MSFRQSILALSLFAAFATVATSADATVVVGKTADAVATTTTYVENFNNGVSSFSRGEYNVAYNNDDYLWLTGAQSSSWSFTSATALKSVTVSFAYAVPGADTGFFKFASTSWVALADTPGTSAEFRNSNPGSTASASGFDGLYSRTYTNLAAGTYTLTFATDAPDCDALSGLKVDDLKITTVSAVPEPETYALMLAGLAGICAMTRRRVGRHD